MTNFAGLIARILDWLIIALQLVLLAMIVLGLTEWWGMSWVIALLLPIPIFVVVFPIIYRLIRGKWLGFYATVFGSLAGCAGLLFISPVLLIFVLMHRFVEGEWPVTFICLCAVNLVLNLVHEYFSKSTADKTPP